MNKSLHAWLFVATCGFLSGVTLVGWDFLRLFLHQDSGASLIGSAWANLSLLRIVMAGLVGAVVGVVVALILASVYFLRVASVREDFSFADAVSTVCDLGWSVAPAFVLFVLTGFSLVLRPAPPYGSDLVVSFFVEGPFLLLLTLGLFGFGALNLFRSPRDPRESLGSSGGPVGDSSPPTGRSWWLRVAVVLVATGIFWSVTPARFLADGAGQGNMFKYLRMAAAVSHTGSLDIRGARGAETEASVSTFVSSLPAVVSRYFLESRRLAGRFAREAASGRLYRGQLSAGRANRSMFRADDGAVYYINAPGPGLALVPAYLCDRFLNRVFQMKRQLAAIAFWNLLGALLVCEIFLSCRQLVGSAPALATSFGLALCAPLLFYTFQIYPELPGGLLLLFAFRKLLMGERASTAATFVGSLSLAFLPWLHQKYSVVSAVIAIMAFVGLVRTSAQAKRRETIVKGLALTVPLVFSAYSIFLFNHAITGGLQPTATFEAAGRSSFEPQNSLKGLLGLLLDRDNGLFVFAPIYLLAIPGLFSLYRGHRRLCRRLLIVLASYMLVIASFPYWPGAVSTMARYISSALPLLALPVALVVQRAFRDGAVAGIVLLLWSGSLSYTLSFAKDLIPSYHAQLLWHRAWFSDPNRYLPDLLTDGIVGSGPAHGVKLGALVVVVALLAVCIYRRMRVEAVAHRFSRRAGLACGAFFFFAAIVSMAVERAPENETEKDYPVYASTRHLDPFRRVTASGKFWLEQNGYWIPGAGRTEFWFVTPRAVERLRVVVRSGPIDNVVRFFADRGAATEIAIPAERQVRRQIRLSTGLRFEATDGPRYLHRFWVQADESFVPANFGESEDFRRLGVFVRFR